jgi:hypothetical protein
MQQVPVAELAGGNLKLDGSSQCKGVCLSSRQGESSAADAGDTGTGKAGRIRRGPRHPQDEPENNRVAFSQGMPHMRHTQDDMSAVLLVLLPGRQPLQQPQLTRQRPTTHTPTCAMMLSAGGGPHKVDTTPKRHTCVSAACRQHPRTHKQRQGQPAHCTNTTHVARVVVPLCVLFV